MRYTSLGLGSIILAALGVTNDDPAQNERLGALEGGLSTLTTNFAQMRADFEANGNLDADQQASLEAMGADLAGIASALNRAAPEVVPVSDGDPTVFEPTPEELPAAAPVEGEQQEEQQEDQQQV